jgi:plastocyanin
VKLSYSLAPAHNLRACVGAFVFALLAAACERTSEPGDQGPRTLELNGDTLQLDAGVTLRDVKVRSTQSGDFDPTETRANVGDIVRFTSGDTRTHGVVIAAPTPDAQATLDAAGQSRSPPLVAQGQAWVVSLSRLPPGRYAMSCISHAGKATLIVQ